MNIEKANQIKKYQLMPCDNKDQKGISIPKKRVLIGRSQACEIQISSNDVTAIHAVLEIRHDSFRIYDMNSTNGTFVNGEKVVNSSIKIGDILRFGSREFKFQLYEKQLAPAAPLEILEAARNKNSLEGIEEKSQKEDDNKKQVSNIVPFVSYPLGKDPRAEFSEYIFEDADTIFPIFDYQIDKKSIEVIILFDDKIHSVDYLPLDSGQIKLTGKANSSGVHYASLKKNESIPFIDLKEKKVLVYPPEDYEILSLNKTNVSKGSLELKNDDILRFSRGSLEIYVRGSDAPPVVQAAPILRRDPFFLKSLLGCFVIVFFMLFGLNQWEVDEELEQEKIPERIATILYQKKAPKVEINKKGDTVNKTSLQKNKVNKENISTKKVSNQTSPGIKKTAKKKIPKVAKPNKSKKTNLKKREAKVTQSVGGSAKNAPKAKKRNVRKKSSGKKDVYKAINFAPTVNNLLARSEGASSPGVATSNADEGETSVITGGESATLKSAKVVTNVGNLDGDKNGSLDGGQGGADIVNKRTSYISSGLPYKMVIQGGMDPDLIRKILRDYLPQFYYCQQKELDTRAFDGVAKLNFLIGASGHVVKSRVSNSRNIPTGVQKCILGVLRGIKFPAPPGGGVVEVNQGLDLKSRKR